MFANSIRQLAEYRERWRQRGSSVPEPAVVNEVLKRLGQMNRILGIVLTLDAESRAINAAITDYARTEEGAPPAPELFHRMTAIGQDIEMHTEAFYYFAFRLREVIRRIPGFGKFEAVGIRDVRNHLIEHPERTSTVLDGSFKHGGAEGPVLKPMRSEAQKDVSRDRGLFVNADEMRNEIERRLARLAGEDSATV